VTATDVNGCTKTATATVSQPPTELTVDLIFANISCFNGSDGAINLTASGGTSGYTYKWNDGATDEDRTNLSQGSYTVTATDVNGCTATATANIGQPNELIASTTATDASCFGSNNGASSVAATGGTGTATFVWSNGQTTETATGLTFGSYTVTATDANNCTTTATVSVSQPPELNVTTEKVTDAIPGSSNGAIDITATGGALPYSFTWKHLASGAVYTTEDLTNIPAGTYQLTLEDGNKCTKVVAFEVKEVSATNILIEWKDWHLFPNPNEGKFTIRGSFSFYADGLKLQIFSAIGGYQASFIPSALELSNGFEVAMENAEPGMYCIQLWSEDVLIGCRLFLVTRP